MVCDIEEAALAKAVEGLKRTNADVDGVRADVSLKQELKAAADATIARYGKVHIRSSLIQFGGCDGKVANWIRHVSGSQAAPLASAYAPLSRTTAA